MAMDMDPPIADDPAVAAPDALIDHAASISYWNSVSADNTGMLGGFPQTSRIDLQGSSNFLAKLRRAAAAKSASSTSATPSSSTSAKEAPPRLARAADCGAGVGRVTNGFLLNVADVVDIVEPVAKFTDALATQGTVAGEGKGKVGDIVNLGLQDWRPASGAYDLIWNQWCLGHLTDAQLVEYLERCKDGLVADTPAAWIVVKENLSTDAWNKDIYDEVDSSVTRSDVKFRELFAKAGLRIVADELQRGFPRDLFPVRMYALKPQ